MYCCLRTSKLHNFITTATLPPYTQPLPPSPTHTPCKQHWAVDYCKPSLAFAYCFSHDKDNKHFCWLLHKRVCFASQIEESLILDREDEPEPATTITFTDFLLSNATLFPLLFKTYTLRTITTSANKRTAAKTEKIAVQISMMFTKIEENTALMAWSAQSFFNISARTNFLTLQLDQGCGGSIITWRDTWQHMWIFIVLFLELPLFWLERTYIPTVLTVNRCASGILQRWVNLVSSLNNKNRPRKLLFCVTRACKFQHEEASWYIRLSHMCWPFSWLRIFINSEAMYLDRAAWIKTLICCIKLAKKTWRGGGMGQEVGEGGGLCLWISGLFGLTFWQYVVSFFFSKYLI